MASVTQALVLPALSRTGFLKGGVTIISYFRDLKSQNASVVVHEDAATEAFEKEVQRLFAEDPMTMVKYLEQIDSPEAWLYWHPSTEPYRVTLEDILASELAQELFASRSDLFSRDEMWFHVVRPQSTRQKKEGLVRMVNGLTPPQEVIVPYYGFNSLSSVSYDEVARKATVVAPTICDRALIDNVIIGIIFNEFHFADNEEQVEAFVTQIGAASTRPFPPLRPLPPLPNPMRKLELDENYDDDDDDEAQHEAKHKRLKLDEADEAQEGEQQGAAVEEEEEEMDLVDTAKALAVRLSSASQDARKECLGIFMDTLDPQEFLEVLAKPSWKPANA
ncbi:MAG: hypothetical protein M1835_006633 [Candelina submexicana]|nr:MAG: hypothetical protein M1835_006633 [Candelina submexicana]